MVLDWMTTEGEVVDAPVTMTVVTAWGTVALPEAELVGELEDAALDPLFEDDELEAGPELELDTIAEEDADEEEPETTAEDDVDEEVAKPEIELDADVDVEFESKQVFW